MGSVIHLRKPNCSAKFTKSSGYRSIAYISGLPQIPTSKHREMGYRRALESCGIPFREDLVKYGDSTLSSGVKLTLECHMT